MSHEITINSQGFAEAAFAKQAAWHGLGQVLPDLMTSAEAMEAAHLDWQVVQMPVAIGCPAQSWTSRKPVSPAVIPHGINWTRQDSHKWNVRKDTGDILGLVGKDYKVVQNHESFQFLDQLVEQGEMRYEAAFSMRDSKQVILLAKLPEMDYITEHDAAERFVLFSNSHDGSSAIQFGMTQVRVVCANTYALALERNGKSIKQLKLRHSGSISDKLQEARHWLKIANDQFDVTAQAQRTMAQQVLTRDQWADFLNIMCPVPHVADPDYSETRLQNIMQTREAIKGNFSNELQTFDGAAGTAWAAFNAVTEHIDHLPRKGANMQRRAEARFNVTQYGAGRDQKHRAFKTLCNLVGC